MKVQLLDAGYWNSKYVHNETGWDLGQVSPPLKAYFDSIENKEAFILIPGCGNCYEAEYLSSLGFTHITIIDIAPTLVQNLQSKFAANKNIKIVCDDFFNHNGQYDYVIEQTFFCALDPSLRVSYAKKMNELLAPNGILVGLLFNTFFEKQGPPFGCTKSEYHTLFSAHFNIYQMQAAKDSISSRANTELFFIAQK